MSFLLGVPAKLKTISDNITTLLTRVSATKSGYLDAAITSRAAASSALSTADWTGPRATLLDELAKVEGLRTNPELAPPISVNAITAFPNIGRALGYVAGLQSYTKSLSAANTWENAITINGKGVVSFLALFNSSAVMRGYRIIIDGVTVVANVSALSGDIWAGVVPIGAVGVDTSLVNNVSVTFDSFPFHTSFVVDVYAAATTGSVGAYAKWRKTA